MNRIKELRECRNISQEELATALDTTQQSISLYESGDREPKLKIWQKLADFFKVPIPYLQGFDKYQPNKLKELRDKKGVSQSQFVQAFNELLISKKMKPITIPTYSRWENSINSPTEKVWQQLAKYFQVSVSYLKGEIDTEYLEKLVELLMLISFPNVALKYRNNELDDSYRPFLAIAITSQISKLLGYDSKEKFQEIYDQAIKLIDNPENINELRKYKGQFIELLTKSKDITNNLLQTYNNL
ncbi:helix-turn-helix transcriptional regulator [Lactobacillus melliventris]|uniref:helix-turn-helix transcriptional regulator n=1 Tax=Lactobacillus melliventris TaxID=1218507 RepID=UPI0015800A85|nr:helix-turn-helix transcriptional regulator [Lactobacillus melliventris]NUE98875.1 transcriptional regulator [Lactobacillus melliventris]